MTTKKKAILAISIIVFVAVACVASFFILKSMHHEAGLEMEKLYGISRHNAEVYANCREYEEQIAEALDIAKAPDGIGIEEGTEKLSSIKESIDPASLTLSNGEVFRYDYLIEMCDSGIEYVTITMPKSSYSSMVQANRERIEEDSLTSYELRETLLSLEEIRETITEASDEFSDILEECDDVISECESKLAEVSEAEEAEKSSSQPLDGYPGTIAEDMLAEEGNTVLTLSFEA